LPYFLPNFNLIADFYAPGTPPPVGPVTFANIPCQHYVLPKVYQQQLVASVLRIPLNSVGAMVSYPGVGPGWIAECPVGSGRFYLCQQMARVHEGFLNEYWQIVAPQINAALLPAIVNQTSIP
jgi:hypothetical protein